MSSRSLTTFTHEADLAGLWSMLQVRRPGGSKTERKFIQEFLAPLDLQTDGFGNLYKRIGDAPILWSSHTDSVHKEGGRQKIRLRGNKIVLSPDSKSNCLGADDAAGMWLMREMIKAERPGLYVFHRLEEKGAFGSTHIAKNEQALIKGIKAAIAFDRRNTSHVITHQMCGRCCSDDFAKSLASALGAGGLTGYEPNDGGTFTDTANYVDLIGECTNVSVGYENEHHLTEELNYEHILMLREALLKVSVDQLVFKRDPGEMEEADCDFLYDRYDRDLNGSGGGMYGGNSRTFREFPKHMAKANKKVGGWSNLDDDDDTNVLDACRRWTITDLCREYPDEVGDWLELQGLDTYEIIEHIVQMNGAIRRRR